MPKIEVNLACPWFLGLSLRGSVPHLVTLQVQLIELFPVEKIVENQINKMNPEDLETMVYKVADQEFAAIQILGFIIGALCGVGIYFSQ